MEKNLINLGYPTLKYHRMKLKVGPCCSLGVMKSSFVSVQAAVFISQALKYRQMRSCARHNAKVRIKLKWIPQSVDCHLLSLVHTSATDVSYQK